MAMQMETEHENVLVVHASGKLTREDYELFVPKLDELLKEKGKVRVLFDMQDFRGWKPGAVWEDIKLTCQHYSDVERLAVIGEKGWQRGITAACKPFTRAAVRYFTRGESEEAHRWVEES